MLFVCFKVVIFEFMFIMLQYKLVYNVEVVLKFHCSI